jgi:membrane dipeptidase
MMVPNWVRGESDPEEMGAGLEIIADNIERVCMLAGSTAHAAIGSDLDGAFGKEQSPYDLETIADLIKVAEILSDRNFTDEDIAGIMGGNWINFLKKTWS